VSFHYPSSTKNRGEVAMIASLEEMSAEDYRETTGHPIEVLDTAAFHANPLVLSRHKELFFQVFQRDQNDPNYLAKIDQTYLNTIRPPYPSALAMVRLASGLIVAMGQANHHDGGVHKIENIMVDEAHRRKQYSRTIMQKLMGLLKAHEPDGGVYLTCAPQHVPMYAEYGFRIWFGENPPLV
jgi:ribosomal protein S18 acetylase RimI-like enzyme